MAGETSEGMSLKNQSNSQKKPPGEPERFQDGIPEEIPKRIPGE